MADSLYGPKLLVKAITASNFGDVQVCDEPYIGDNGTEYIVYAGCLLAADTDTINVLYRTPSTATGWTSAEVVTGLKKYKRYTFAMHQHRCYISNGEDHIFWIYADVSGNLTTGFIDNAPIAEYLISAKNALWAGGRSISYYFTGTATFTQTSTTVAGQSTIWTTNLRAGDDIGVATSYSSGNALFTKGSLTVTGATTSWLANVHVGAKIGTGASPTIWYTVAKIVSDTSILLAKPYAETTTTSTSYKVLKVPTTYYKVKSITNDTSLELTALFAEATATTTNYVAKRYVNDGVYWSAELCLNDWLINGVLGGYDAGLIQLGKKNTGLHNFDDAVLFMTEDGGDYVVGTDPTNWQIPRSTKLPVGCVSHDSIVSKDGWLGFMGKNGYYVTKGSTLNFSDLGATAYSDPIIQWIRDIDPDKYSYIQASVWKDSLYISVPSMSVYSDVDAELSYSTGTVTVSASSAVVTGSGSSWRGRIRPGDEIKFQGETDYYTISTVDSNTQVTLNKTRAAVTAGSTYVIQRQRNNRVLVLDTRTDISKPRSYGWGKFDNINPNGFVIIAGNLYYGSFTSGYVYEYDTGGTLYGQSIISTAKFGRWDCGLSGVWKEFKSCLISGKGYGILYLTPYYDGVAGATVQYQFNSTQYIDVVFPRAGQYFGGRGTEIEIEIEFNGVNEDIVIKEPQIGFLPIKRY